MCQIWAIFRVDLNAYSEDLVAKLCTLADLMIDLNAIHKLHSSYSFEDTFA